MSKVFFILFLFFSTALHAQKEGDIITVTNPDWDCGGYSPEKAKVVRVKGSLYICYLGDKDFVWDRCLPIKKALAYWKWEGTKIVKIKHKKP